MYSQPEKFPTLYRYIDHIIFRAKENEFITVFSWYLFDIARIV